MSDIGWLYCFENVSMPGIYKIGLTMRTPEERLAEANASDTWRPPTPYTIVFTKRVRCAASKEKQLHNLLSELGFRVHPRREFFNASFSVITGLFALLDEEPIDQSETDEEGDVDDNSSVEDTMTSTPTYTKEPCPFCECKGRSYRHPYHYITHHIDKVRLRQTQSEHCVFAYMQTDDSQEIGFCFCLSCKKGTADSGLTSNSARWVTMHAKQEQCKVAHADAFKVLKQRMGITYS